MRLLRKTTPTEVPDRSMHLLYCDESNLERRFGDFLIYGGMVIDSNNAHALSNEIDDIRAEADVDRDFRLKFNPGPPNLSHQEFLELKQAVIEAAIRHGAKLLIYLILHNIARDADEARRFGINTICYHFYCLLLRLKGPGLVLIDRFNDQGNQIDAHLAEKFAVGVVGLPQYPERRLSNIIGFHNSAVGQSHFPSLVDIVLGSFRFAINAHTRAQDANMRTAGRLLGILEPLFFREPDGAPISNLSVWFSPMEVHSPFYRQKYHRLKEFLEQSGLNTAQEIIG